MTGAMADALAEFRAANYDRVYMRPASLAQASVVIAMLRALVEHFTDRPHGISSARSRPGVAAGSDEAMRAAVTYVAGHDRSLRLPDGGVQARLGHVPPPPQRR